ncbi:zinc finger protein-domain-containing protein [Exophiala viscosa]|uniref:Zinc finger protein-domain-containing protein n=1 Tax=Exophiala viscosa TaxID=2486360 RepID=A0AAN6IDB7_9EURO|nr:zinc finger protein-domain-containing protein [Exophiala viscosa]KAI1626387.1 zinc finger protein-domain-containing protein [Exophiala viscosa]
MPPLLWTSITIAIIGTSRWVVHLFHDAVSIAILVCCGRDTLQQRTPGLSEPRAIGKGQCGEIWTRVGSVVVTKTNNPGKEDQLWNDSCMHRLIEETMRTTPTSLQRDINIPKFEMLASLTHKFWNDVPEHIRPNIKPKYGLVSSRIRPVTEALRRDIVKAFAPSSANKRSALTELENQDCLVRLYLGRREKRFDRQAFRLRNFDLMVNEMEELQLDTSKFAAIMGKTLSILHWSAHVDADDVEFVLGRSPTLKMRASATDCNDSNKDDVCQDFTSDERHNVIWLLDFDQCKSLDDNDAGIKQLMQSFYFNDPYYPRPEANHPNDVALWATFRDNYLEASGLLTAIMMPARFIEAVETEARRRKAGGSIFGRSDNNAGYRK